MLSLIYVIFISMLMIFFVDLTGGGVENPAFFFSLITENENVVFLVVAAIWGCLDTTVICIFVYRKMRNYPTTALITSVSVVLSLLEWIGIFFKFPGSSAFLLMWPIVNFLRVFDVVIAIIFRSKSACLPQCLGYNRVFLILDILGTASGFMVADADLWEKIVVLAVEVVDATFSLIYYLFRNGNVMSVAFLVVMCFVKIVAMAVKIAVSLKGYIVVHSECCSLVMGCIGGVCFCATFMMAQVTFLVTDKAKQGSWMFVYVIPLLLFMIVLGYVSMYHTKWEEEQSVFFDDE